MWTAANGWKDKSMKNVVCYNCNTSDATPYDVENGFTLVRCNTCGLIYLTPRPDDKEISNASKCGIHKGEKALDFTGSFSYSKVKNYLKILDDFYGDEMKGKESTWLDIGCGFGEFLLALKQYSEGKIEVVGVEPNVKKQAVAREKGIDVRFFDLDGHDGQYDVISALNVFSHLPQPIDSFRSWSRLLKPDGEFFLETGDTAGLERSAHPRPYYLPDHLSFASEAILASILERLDFDIVAIHKYNFYNLSAKNLAKECIKLCIPNKKSHLVSLFRCNKLKTDMYIRARQRRAAKC